MPRRARRRREPSAIGSSAYDDLKPSGESAEVVLAELVRDARIGAQNTRHMRVLEIRGDPNPAVQPELGARGRKKPRLSEVEILGILGECGRLTIRIRPGASARIRHEP